MIAQQRKTASNTGIRWESDLLTLKSASEIAAVWEDLALHAVEKNIFSFPWFVIPSLPLLDKKEPKIVTVYDGALLIGLFMICQDRGYAKLPLSFARTALHPDQFLGTPLVREGYVDQFATGLCEWLDSAPSKMSFVVLALLTAEQEISDAIIAACKAQKRGLVEVDRFERAAIEPKISPAAHIDERISKGRRKSLRRKMRRLNEEGAVTIEQLSDKKDLNAWIEDFMEMENSGWKKQNASSILSYPEDATFFRDMLTAAFSRGSLNFFRLCVDGKPISYTVDIVCAPEAYCLKTAFDPAYRKFSPGVLMEYETLKYYSNRSDISSVDSCTDPDNQMLNEIWPDRKTIIELAIARTDEPYRRLFSTAHFLKKHGKQLLQIFPANRTKRSKAVQTANIDSHSARLR